MAKYPIDRPMTRHGIDRGYWELRKGKDLYKVLHNLARLYTADVRSAIDVGCYVGGVICDLDWIPRRVASDLNNYTKEWADVDGVTFIHADAFTLEETYDLVISNQTIEHIGDAKGFAEKLCALGKTVIVSTTYLVPQGKIEGHIQDPIDLDKFLGWFPRKPKCVAIVNEPHQDNIIGVF